MRCHPISAVALSFLSIWSVLALVESGWCEWGEPVNLGPKVNWAGGDYYPSISAAGTTLYYTSNSRPTGYGDDDIWISTWNGLEWGPPVNAGPNVNSEWRDLSPSISADGERLYFVSYERPGGYGAYDVWVSTWEGTMWGPASNLGPNVNTAYYEFTLGISFDEKKVYFSSSRPGGLGDDDIWVSEWDSAGGEWGPAANLGPGVNTYNRDYCPCPSSDGAKLYFARWLGFSHPDIFVSQWEDTAWGVAVNLGVPINTPTWDDGPSISSDGLRLYFASSRDTTRPAVQDIWVSEWVPGVQEEEGPKRSKEEVSLTCLPNPFSSTTVIRYTVAEPGHVGLRIYELAGHLVRTLVDRIEEPGTQEIFWDGRNNRGEALPSGIYFCRIEAGGRSVTGKLHLVR